MLSHRLVLGYDLTIAMTSRQIATLIKAVSSFVGMVSVTLSF